MMQEPQAAEDMVKITTSDGKTFRIPKEKAEQSNTLANLLSDLEGVNEETPIPLANVSAEVFVRILGLLEHDSVTQDSLNQDLGGTLPDQTRLIRAIELLKAVNFLDIPLIFESLTKYLSRSYTTAQITQWQTTGILHDDLVLFLLNLKKPKHIAAGEKHSCALLYRGTVKGWGSGFYGQLGQGNTDNIGDQPDQMGDNLNPINIGTGRTAKAITAGGTHTCALLDNNQVKCWGSGFHGQLGQGNGNSIDGQPNQMGDNLPPINIGTGRTAKEITAGNAHTCVRLDNNEVKCWGEGYYGQLGQGNGNRNNIGNRPNQMGDNLPPIDLGHGRTAKEITAGVRHTCVLLDNDTVKCWGGGFAGQLGQSNNTNIGDLPGQMGDNLPPIEL